MLFLLSPMVFVGGGGERVRTHDFLFTKLMLQPLAPRPRKRMLRNLTIVAALNAVLKLLP